MSRSSGKGKSSETTLVRWSNSRQNRAPGTGIASAASSELNVTMSAMPPDSNADGDAAAAAAAATGTGGHVQLLDGKSSVATSSITSPRDTAVSRARKQRLNFQRKGSTVGSVGARSRSPSTTKITTGASLIPNLNLVINRMRARQDDAFVYMDYMLPHDSEYFTPYSLREVEYEDLNPYEPFFTVTRHGVTFWHCSENFFTPLDQWQQEFVQFLSIIQIRSFSIFRLWKGFKVWEKTIKWRKLNEARDYLHNNLFIVIPQLAKAILRMRAEIVQMERLNFVNISNIENWHPFYFLETHMRIYEQLHKIFHDFRTQFGVSIFRACTDAIQARGFYPDDEVNYYPSMKKMREAHSFMDRARKRAFCKTLTNFLTYSDMMVFQMLYRITTKSFEDLAHAFEEHDAVGPTDADISRHSRTDKRVERQRPADKPQHPFFLAMLRLLPDRIDIEPSEEVIKIIFQRITGLILETVLDIRPFTTDPYFKQYTEPSIMGRQEEVLYDGAPDLHWLLRADSTFQFNRKNIFYLLRKAYDRARTYTERFHAIRENFEIDTHTDPETLSSERDLTTLRNYCDRYCNNVRALDGILEFVYLGLLKLTQTNFKDAVTPVCQRLQNVLATYLPKLAEEETTRLYEEAQDFFGRICFEPQETLDIVNHIRFLDTCSAELDIIFEGIDYVHDLLLIIKDFAIPIDDDRKEDYMDTEDYVNRTKDTLLEIQEKRQEFINRLEEAMMDDIFTLKEEIHVIAVEALEPWLLNNMDRVFKISEQIIVGGGGDFGGIQKYKDTIDAQVIADRIYWAAFEMKPKTDDHTAVLIVVGGMDPKTGPYLSSIDCRGRIVEDYVVTTGPALQAVLPMVRNNKPKDREFSEQEALAMIWKGMTGALHCPDAREIPSYTVGICSANGCHIEGPYRANKDWTHARHNEAML